MSVFIYKIYLVEVPEICYVGSTTKLKVRFARHKASLLKGEHYNYKLQEMYNSCANKELVMETICECENSNRYSIEYENIVSQGNTYNLFVNPKRFGDSISYHPKKQSIVSKMKNTLNQKLANMTKEEIKVKFAKNGSDNPNWRGGTSVSYCACGNKKALKALNCAYCRDRTGSKNPFFGKTHSKEVIERVAQANRGRKPINSRKVSANGIEYSSATEVAKFLGCTTSTILNRCNSDKNKDYFFIL